MYEIAQLRDKLTAQHEAPDAPYLLNVMESAWAFLTTWYAGNGQDSETCEAAIGLLAALSPGASTNTRNRQVAQLIKGEGIAWNARLAPTPTQPGAGGQP